MLLIEKKTQSKNSKKVTVTGASTLWTLDSSTRISLALAQRALTSDSLMISHFLNCSICLSRSDMVISALKVSVLFHKKVFFLFRAGEYSIKIYKLLILSLFCLGSELGPKDYVLKSLIIPCDTDDRNNTG